MAVQTAGHFSCNIFIRGYQGGQYFFQHCEPQRVVSVCGMARQSTVVYPDAGWLLSRPAVRFWTEKLSKFFTGHGFDWQ
jgi:hypothetical protein